MATAELFRAAARTLRAAADSASDAGFRVRTASYAVGVVGCELAELVDRAMMAAQVMAAGLESTCLCAEQEALARAETCESYSAHYSQWQASRARWEDLRFIASSSDGRTADPGPPPPMPPKPAIWVELP